MTARLCSRCLEATAETDSDLCGMCVHDRIRNGLDKLVPYTPKKRPVVKTTKPGLKRFLEYVRGS